MPTVTPGVVSSPALFPCTQNSKLHLHILEIRGSWGTIIIWGSRQSLTVTLSTHKDFPHDHARSRAYRWGEDGIAGVSDTHGFQNIAFAFWNEKECVCNLPIRFTRPRR